jgi:GntR family transcriptional regulator
MLPAAVKFSINKDSTVSVRDQLIEQIGLQIASGALKGKEKLPSIRALAQRLGIHHSTVTAAYNHLAEVGLLEVRQGSGVRVASKVTARDTEGERELKELFKTFLARAADNGYSAEDVSRCFDDMKKGRKHVKRILVVDRNRDFHKLLLAELQPHFSLPVQPLTAEDLAQDQSILDDSLLLSSLYHVFPLQRLNIDPTRFVVCNIEPARSELEVVRNLPAGSIILLVSLSPTLLKMATNMSAAVRGEEVAVRTVLLDDDQELAYMIKYAKAIICDGPSEEKVKKLAATSIVPVHVFRLYAPSTIELIKQRLAQWG